MTVNYLLLYFIFLLFSSEQIQILKGASIMNRLKREVEERAGENPLSQLTQIPGQFQQGLSSLSGTMKDGRMVIGGFSMLIVPPPDMAQLQGLPMMSGLPQIPSLPGSSS